MLDMQHHDHPLEEWSFDRSEWLATIVFVAGVILFIAVWWLMGEHDFI